MERITEAAGVVAPVTGKTQLVTLITPGWGSSGYYSAEALQQAVADRVWPSRTQMYIDHPTAEEQHVRPERSLQTLAAVLVEDAYWNSQESAVQAKARVFPRWREDLTEMAETDTVGVSIYTMAESEPGEAEGRQGMIVKRLVADPRNTVDYVTQPGRGGRVSAVLEAAREATHNDLREKLRTALQRGYATQDGDYVWVLDSDDENVWFELEANGASRTYQQSYSQNGENVLLTDSPVEVARKVIWEPVAPETDEEASEANDKNSPSEPAGGAQGKESAVADITINEEELTQLRESSSRAAELEKQLDELKQERAAEAAQARSTRAEDAVRTAFGDDAPEFYLEAARAAAASEDYDHDAFVAKVSEAAAVRRSAEGAGEPNLGNGVAQESTVTKRNAEDIIMALKQG